MRAVLLSFLMLSAGLLNAQTTAKQLLQQVKDQLQATQSIQYDYSLNIDLPEQDPIVMEGTFKKQGDQYHATMGNRWIKSNGNTQWIYDPDLHEVQIYEANAEQGLPVSPEKVTELFESEDYENAITGKDQMNGKEVTFIEFKSLDAGSEYVKMRLALYSESVQPVYFKVFGRDGSRYTLSIDEIKEDVSFTKGEFTFDPSKYPDVHVEDLRM